MQTSGQARQALDGHVICLTAASPCRRMLVKRRWRHRARAGFSRLTQLVSSVVRHSSTSLPRRHRRHHLIRDFINLLLTLLKIPANKQMIQVRTERMILIS